MNKSIENYIEKLLNESTPTSPIWNVEILRGKEPGWNYIDGCMMTSLLELYKIRKDKKYLDFVIKYTDYFIEDGKSIKGYNPLNYSLDDLSESRILFDLYAYTKEKKYLNAIKYTYTQIFSQPRCYLGNFWHKPRHPHQIWLDGLYMAQPFYMRYETEINNKLNYRDIRHQYENVREYMFNEKDRLYYHGLDASRTIFWADKETGLSKGYWLRALGWFIISLVDVIEYIDPNSEDKEFYIKLFTEAIDGILLYQDKSSKMFWQVPNMGGREGNYLETSGSAMISYAILKGVRLNALSSEYQRIGLDIFDGICRRYLTEGENGINLGGICLLAGLGNDPKRDGSFEYYISEPIVENDAKGVGPFIMAYTEIIRLEK